VEERRDAAILIDQGRLKHDLIEQEGGVILGLGRAGRGGLLTSGNPLLCQRSLQQPGRVTQASKQIAREKLGLYIEKRTTRISESMSDCIKGY